MRSGRIGAPLAAWRCEPERSDRASRAARCNLQWRYARHVRQASGRASILLCRFRSYAFSFRHAVGFRCYRISPSGAQPVLEAELVYDLLHNEVHKVVERLLTAVEPRHCRYNGHPELGKGEQI